MSAARPMPSAAEQLADAFATQAADWARRRQAPGAAVTAVRSAARALSLATSQGHVCLSLGDLSAAERSTRSAPAWRQLLLDSRLVAPAHAPGAMPLVLDGGDRLYLHRYFDYEQRLARRLARALSAAPTPGDPATQALLAQLFAAHGGARSTAGAPESPGEPDWQRVAAALALRQRLTVISGGPGTGKTTTVVNLLACLLAQDPSCRIALAAPTGKAAARLGEALRARAALLPDALRARLPVEAMTLHRLLGSMGPSGRFRHHVANQLAVDALIVDEASMLDLALATRLFEAVPDSARIILLGDKDQLAAVEAGAVFAELSANPALSARCREDLAPACGVLPAQLLQTAASDQEPIGAPRGPADSAIWFTRNFRFAHDSGIGRLAAGIRAGRAQDTVNALAEGGDGDVQWLRTSSPEAADAHQQKLIAAAAAGFAAYFDALQRNAGDVAAAMQAFASFRVLCALHGGALGVQALNRALTQHAQARLSAAAAAGPAQGAIASPPWPASDWYLGRPVMVLSNDHGLRLFNGDVGLTLPGPDGRLQVHFAQADGGFRAVDPLRLPQHQTAYAMSVHKSQGSEFDAVLVLLPEQPSPVLTRELLYTAVTRARRHVMLAASAEILERAIASPTQRRSGLLARLIEATPMPVPPTA